MYIHPHIPTTSYLLTFSMYVGRCACSSYQLAGNSSYTHTLPYTDHQPARLIVLRMRARDRPSTSQTTYLPVEHHLRRAIVYVCIVRRIAPIETTNSIPLWLGTKYVYQGNQWITTTYLRVSPPFSSRTSSNLEVGMYVDLHIYVPNVRTTCIHTLVVFLSPKP